MPPFRGADLHCHSTFSDGVDTPARLVSHAVEAGLSVLALSDHDALHGLPEFEGAAKGTGLVTVAGSELSTSCEGDDVHVLGLFLDPEEAGMKAHLERFRVDRDARGEAMVGKLGALGMPLSVAAIREVVGAGSFGRPHVARAMVAKGYVKSLDEAFDKWLAHGRPGYVPKPKWTLEEAIAAIRAAGGLSVVAHPIWYQDAARVVALGAAAGLDGLEVYHLDQEGKENEFGSLAEQHGLLKSAGSDYHGPAEGKRRVGACRLDAAGWERMVAAAHQRRAETGRPPLDVSPR